MQKRVNTATIEDVDFIYESLTADLSEQGLLHRFKYDKNEFANIVFGTKPWAYFLILLIDGQRAGFANYSIDYRNFTVNSLANLYLNDLFVKKEYRRMGGATLLMKTLQEIAIRKNCGRIEFFVLKENKEALGFYERFKDCKIISNKLHYLRLEVI